MPGPITTARSPLAAAGRFVAALVVGAHAALHVVGFLLLWKVTEVGDFTYDLATPEAGSVGGRVVGVAWLVAAVLFLVTAAQLAASRPGWARAAVAAVIVSTVALAADPVDAAAGLVVNAVVLGAALLELRTSQPVPAGTDGR